MRFDDSIENITEKIKASVSLQELIADDGIELRQVGQQLVGWHSNKHGSDSRTSLTVNPEKGLYYCFHCLEGGDVFSYVELNRGMTFNEAKAYLAARAGIKLPGRDMTPEEQAAYDAKRKEQLELWKEQQELFALYTAAAELYHEMLGDRGRKLLLDKWALTAETAKKYLFGFAPGGRFILKKLKDKGFDVGLIKKSGLVNRGGYDFFNKRLIFPYWKADRVVYFIGRRIDGVTPDDEWELAKYKKLPVNDGSEKREHISRAVSNEFFCGENLAADDELIITEGIADFYAAVQAGLSCISPVTVSFREADWPKLTRLAKRAKLVFICNDNETSGAGAAGALKTAGHLVARGVDVRIIELPRPGGVGKVDLADFLRGSGPAAFRELMKQAKKAKQAEKTPEKKAVPVLVNLGEVEPEEVEFAWNPYVPKKKLTVVDGDPGIGKTFLSLSLCTAVSRGWPMPGQDGRPGDAVEAGTVLFMTAEDGLADTIVPRLEKMGADRGKIYCLTGWKETEEGEEKAFTLKDVDVLKEALTQVRPLLVVVDPIQAYLGPIDMHRANETRPVLSALGKLAEEYGCAVIALRHLNKAGGGKALYRGLGSIDIAAAARSVLLVGMNPETGERAVVQTKSSCAEKGVAQRFTINNLEGFLWAGKSDCEEGDLLSMPITEKKKDDVPAPALDEAKEFFLGILAGGEKVPCEDVKKKYKKIGITEKTARRAREELGVKFTYRKKENPNCWYLPDSGNFDPENSKNEENNEKYVAHANTDGQDGQDTQTPIKSAFTYLAHVAHAQSDGQHTFKQKEALSKHSDTSELLEVNI